MMFPPAQICAQFAVEVLAAFWLGGANCRQGGLLYPDSVLQKIKPYMNYLHISVVFLQQTSRSHRAWSEMCW